MAQWKKIIVSGSNAKSEWLKVKLDAEAGDNIQIDAIGITFRRKPVK